MAAPSVDGHRPKRVTCGGCPDCRHAGLNGAPDTSAWWVTCGGAHSLIWAVCANAAGLELHRIMRLRSVGRGWGTTHHRIERSYYDDEGQLHIKSPGELIEEELQEAGIVARPTTDEDRERWAAMVRQQQGLEALETSQ